MITCQKQKQCIEHWCDQQGVCKHRWNLGKISICFQASWCDMCNTFSLSLNSDTILWAWLKKSWKCEALMLKSLPRSTSSIKKGSPNVCLTQSFWKQCSVAESKSWWFDLINYHRLNFFFSQFASMPFGHSSAILALGLSMLYLLLSPPMKIWSSNLTNCYVCSEAAGASLRSAIKEYRLSQASDSCSASPTNIVKSKH